MRTADFLESNVSSLSIALSPVLVRLIGRYFCNRITPRCLWLLTLAFVRAIGRVSCNRLIGRYLEPCLIANGFCPWVSSVWSADFPGTALLLVAPGSRPELQSVGSAIFLEPHCPSLPLAFHGLCTWFFPVASVRVIG